MTQEGTTITLTGDQEGIDDILEDFKAFLLGATFSPELVGQIWRGQEPDPYTGN
jgi:hypothetical protein